MVAAICLRQFILMLSLRFMVTSSPAIERLRCDVLPNFARSSNAEARQHSESLALALRQLAPRRAQRPSFHDSHVFTAFELKFQIASIT
jgi:hypothetical protein